VGREAVVRKVNQKRITNSKDLRKLRAILPDPVAKAHFSRDLESAAPRLGTAKKKGDDGQSGELDAVVEAVKSAPWTALQELKGDTELLKKIEAAETMLHSLRKALS
jgi:ParB family chromosome partitioning protein